MHNLIYGTHADCAFALGDVMRDYPMMATEFPGQVQCILLRNTSNSDPDDRFPYDTSGFKGLDNSTYMFFVVPVSRGEPSASFLLVSQKLTLSFPLQRMT